MNFNDLVAQLAHVGWAALLVDSLAARIRLRWALILVAVFAVGKECVESLWGGWEPVQTWPSSLEDMAFWGVGIFLGYALWRWWDRGNVAHV